ncbi:class I tRNA ligase family protein, partial [Candidatus Gottesmanbacteria bacterium]|nr:class I tRNA ligase family protein [Candidatus Gottesmanbacteria bacterium]
SEENNYAIWNFLKICHERGWIYKGHESIPWCPRCETAISQHEILTEDYKEITHESVYLKLPVVGKNSEYLLVWTTTPWTIPANIAVAVDEKIDYSLVDNCWVATTLVKRIFPAGKILKTVKGQELVGLKYKAPYDYLEATKGIEHKVIATDLLIMPITTEEGTGLVHTAVSAGEEDFKLGKKLGLPMIPVIADNADYLPGLGDLSGQNAQKNPRIILDFLEKEKWAFKIENYSHRYPVCWRCKTELVWKVADEWYISMEELRPELIKIVKKIKWLPEFGLDRELDWLKNMHDWLISKKNRYWGLALPIYECTRCKHFEIIGSKEELKKRAVEGWDKFAGNSPHKPWIDEVKIKCSQCGEKVSRILDVGNPWLDAGIVSVSTMPEDWFPADFITESFPGQFKNWFYSLIVMGTVLKKTNPFKTVLGFATMVDSNGKPFHKSAGNAIEFIEGADHFGADVIRWACVSHDIATNVLFGQKEANQIRRQFFLTLWNVYNFFVTYANLNSFKRGGLLKLNILDEWILARLNEVMKITTDGLEKYDAQSGALAIEKFVEDLSLWYIRRSRSRMTPEFFSTCHEVLVTLSKILAPFTPFIAEEMYKNLMSNKSVHLASWPKSKIKNQKSKLIEQMQLVRKICELGHATRKANNLKGRQPLGEFEIFNLKFEINGSLVQLIKDELNIKTVKQTLGEGDLEIKLDTKLTPELEAEGKARDLIRDIQEARKEAGTALDEKITVYLPAWPKDFEEYIKKETLAIKLVKDNILRIER